MRLECTYMHACMHARTHARTHTHTHTNTHPQIHIHIHIHTYTSTHTHGSVGQQHQHAKHYKAVALKEETATISLIMYSSTGLARFSHPDKYWAVITARGKTSNSGKYQTTWEKLLKGLNLNHFCNTSYCTITIMIHV